MQLKSDKYRKTRGGYARFLNIFCEHCGAKLFAYQKDGSGQLKRLYLDRIISKDFSTRFPKLICKKCKSVLGVHYIYPKERRSAFRLFVSAVTKKIIKA